MRRVGHLDGLDMGARQIAHVDPEEGSRVGELVFAASLQEIADALVGGVERVQRVEIVHDGAQDQRWVDGGHGEIGPFPLDEVPRGFFGKGLGGAVAVGWVLGGVFEGDGVPVCFGVGVLGPVSLEGVDDGGEGGRYHDPFYGGAVFFDGVQDGGCALDGGVQEVFFSVGHVEVELGCWC